MAMDMFGTAGQIGPGNLQYSYGQGEASEGQGFNLGGHQFTYGIMNPGEEGAQYGWRTSGGLTGTDLNALLAQLGLGSGHQGYSMGASSMGDGTESFNLQSTSPFYTPEVQSQFNARYAPWYGGGDWTQFGSSNPQGLKNAGLLFYDPEYGYITPASNYEQRSTFQQLAPLAAVLAAPFAYSALAGLWGGAGAGAASVAPSGFAASPVGFQALPAATGIEGLAGSLGLGAAPASGISPALAALSAPGAGMITPGTIGLGGAGLGPTLWASAAGALPLPANSLGAALTLESMGIPNAAGAAGSGFGAPAAGALPAISPGPGASLGLDAMQPSWGANPMDPLQSIMGPAFGANPATLNPSIAALSQSAPYASGAAQMAAGAGIPVAGGAGSIWNSLPGFFTSLFDDPKELLKLLGSGALSFMGGNQQEKIAGQAAQQADPYAAYRPGDAARYQETQNATNFDNPIYNAMREQMERATIRRGAQQGNLGSANLVNELMTRNAALFNDYRSQELQRLGLTSGAFLDPAMAAQILGGGKAAGLATKYGGAIDALADFLTPDDSLQSLLIALQRGAI